jgi:SH3-like domain-containing protein
MFYVNKILFFYFIILIGSTSFADEGYYLTLRNDKVNLRQGPSLNYPIKLVYNKKFLPILIKDKSGNFRKVLDHENNSGWIHISQLSKKKAALSILDELIVFQKPSIYSKPLVKLEIGRLCLVKKCKNDWCKIKTGGYSGWVEKQNLRGRL